MDFPSSPSANTILLTILAVFSGIKAIIDYLQKEKAQKATEKVADTLKQSNQQTGDALVGIAKQTEQIHMLVNSDWGKLLRAHAVMARNSALLVSRDPASTPEQITLAKRVADDAERESITHDSKQAQIDIKKAADSVE